MPKAAAPHPQDPFDLADLPKENPDDESLDLEAYLDLEESPEITRLMQEMRGQGAEPRAASVPPERLARRAPAPEGVATPARPPVTPPAGRAAATTTGTVLRGAGRPAPERESEPAPARRPGTQGEGRRLDLAAVARALGAASVQARQLVVACPRCEGRASIVIYADRFKCFGCEATGDEQTLAAHLTGWDPRRVSAWLEAAAACPETDEADVRRPWRLSFFAR